MIIITVIKNLIKIISIASIILIFPINTYANSKNITIDQSFSCEDGLWMAGEVQVKDFYINNNNENDVSIDRLYMSLKSSEYWKTGEKLDINSNKFKEFAKYSIVTLKHGDDVLFEDKFENLLSEDGIKLSKDIDIKSNSKELLNMKIEMDLAMNNDAQALNNIFKIGAAYKMKETINPENPNNLPNTGTFINGNNLICLGFAAVGVGIILNKKSKEEKGDKCNE